MRRLTDTDGLSDTQREILRTGLTVPGKIHKMGYKGVDTTELIQTFGKPIAEHQAITFKLAEMATKTVAAHQMMVMAARRKDGGGQTDVEAGMAKYLAAEYCKEVVEDAFRIHGGYGYSSEYEIGPSRTRLTLAGAVS